MNIYWFKTKNFTYNFLQYRWFFRLMVVDTQSIIAGKWERGFG